MIDDIVKQDCLTEQYITKDVEKELEKAVEHERSYLQAKILLAEANNLLNDPHCLLSQQQKSRLEQCVIHNTPLPCTKSDNQIIELLEQQVQMKYDKVKQYILTSNPELKGDVIANVKQKQELLDKTQIQIIRRKAIINNKISEYVNIVLEILSTTWHIIQEFKYKLSNKENDQSFDHYYTSLSDTLLLKIKILHATVLLGTYDDKEFIFALSSLRDLLETRYNNARKSLNAVSRQLQEYNDIEPEFQTLSKAYNDLLYKIESTKQDITRIYQD